jgi:hypothetical protein
VSPERERELGKQMKKIEHQIAAGKNTASYLQGCDSHISLAFLDITPAAPYIH